MSAANWLTVDTLRIGELLMQIRKKRGHPYGSPEKKKNYLAKLFIHCIGFKI